MTAKLVAAFGANAPSVAQPQVNSGSPPVKPVVLTDGEGLIVSVHGSATAAIAAGTAGNTVVKASPGRLCKVLVTATGTAAVNIFDNASAASGTLLGVIAASAAVGTVVDFQMPAANGITVQGNVALPALTISFY